MELQDMLHQKEFQERTPHTNINMPVEQKEAERLHRKGTRLHPSSLTNEIVHGDIEAVERMMRRMSWKEVNEVDVSGMTALHYAAKHDRKDIALLLLNNGASIDRVTRQGDAFHTAIKNRNEDTASILLARGANINSTDASGMTSLHLAVYHRLTDIIMQLLQEDHLPDLNAKDNKMNTALHYSAINGDVIMCRALLDSGALIDARNHANETALHLAAGENSKGVIGVFLSQDFHKLCTTKEEFVNMEREDKKTALHLAAQMGHFEIIADLISHGADINKTTDAGESTLHLAVSSGNENAVKLLLEKGIRIDMINKNRTTPLHSAVSYGHNNIVEILLASAAQLKKRENEGNAPLSSTAQLEKTDTYGNALLPSTAVLEKIVQWNAPLSSTAKSEKRDSKGNVTVFSEAQLEERGNQGNVPLSNNAQLKETDSNGNAPLPSTPELEKTDNKGNAPLSSTVKVEIRHNKGNDTSSSNAQLERRDNQGYAPMSSTAQLEKIDSQEKPPLLSTVQLEMKDNQGNTALLLAIKKANYHLVKRLLDAGADISVQDFDLKTGLHCAIKSNNHEISLLLLDSFKALAYMKDEDGQTPLHYAAHFGHIEMVRLLTKRTMQLNDADNNGETALHLASRNGDAECAELLMNDTKAVALCNQDGKAPLHLSVIHDQPILCEMLLKRHADANQKDTFGWTPLFYAAYLDHSEVLNIILEHKDTDVNCVDNSGNSCLMIASKAGNAKAVSLLLESGANFSSCLEKDSENFFDLAIDLQHESVCKTILESSRCFEALSSKGGEVGHFMRKLIKMYPHLVEIILNRSITFSDHHPADKAFQAEFDFQFLDESPRAIGATAKKAKPLYYGPSVMLQRKRSRLLNHPVVSILMDIKWNRLCRYFYYLRFFFFLLYSTLIHVYIYTDVLNLETRGAYRPPSNSSGSPSNGSGSPSNGPNPPSHSFLSHSFYAFEAKTTSSSIRPLDITILCFAVLQVLSEGFKIWALRLKYFYHIENYIEIILFISVIAAVFNVGVVNEHEIASMALCIFSVWMSLLFYLQGIPLFSIYATMYVRVCETIVKLLVLFSMISACFIIIFGLLKVDHGLFKSTKMRILTFFIMMNGEVGFNEWWFNEGKFTIPFEKTTYLFTFLFIIFVLMAFTNLLIGLAVGDIESVRASAEIHAFEQKLRLTNTLHCIVPRAILMKYVHKSKYTYLVNKKTRIQRFIKYILPDKTDDDLKQLRMKEGSFKCKDIQERNGTKLASNIVTEDDNIGVSSDSNDIEKLVC